MPIKFEMDTTWMKMEKKLDAKAFSKKLKQYVGHATQVNSHLLQAQFRKHLKSGKYKANAPLTIAIKKSTKPLVDTGHRLFQAIAIDLIAWNSSFVGVLMNDDLYNIALALHEGVEIAVTDKMRGMFYLLWQVSIGAVPASELKGRPKELWERMPENWKPLRPSTKAIVVPSRPFVKRAFSATIKKKIIKNWEKAVDFAFNK